MDTRDLRHTPHTSYNSTLEIYVEKKWCSGPF